MEIHEKKFYETLLSYFQHRLKSCNGFDVSIVEKIIQDLEELLTFYGPQYVGRVNPENYVHIGRLFGFEIK